MGHSRNLQSYRASKEKHKGKQFKPYASVSLERGNGHRGERGQRARHLRLGEVSKRNKRLRVYVPRLGKFKIREMDTENEGTGFGGNLKEGQK